MKKVTLKPTSDSFYAFREAKAWTVITIISFIMVATMYLVHSWGYMNAMESNEPYREFYACILYGLDENNQVPLGDCNRALFQKLNMHMNVPAVPTPQQ